MSMMGKYKASMVLKITTCNQCEHKEPLWQFSAASANVTLKIET